MGTSKSSTGPGPNVPLVPPWVPDPIPPATPANGGDDANVPDQQAPPTPVPGPAPNAPAGRFGPARTNLGSFARSGSADEMRRGLGHYVRKGYGGSATAARRMGGTARTAGALYSALSSAAAGHAIPPESPFDPALLSGSSADEIMDALVEAVRPVDGTQDAEAGRAAVRNALSELLGRFPNANLLELSEDQRLFAIERYVALDVYSRFNLDVGKTVKDRAPNSSAALSRLKDVKDYIKQTMSARFRDLREAGEQLGARRIAEMARQALQDAFAVFEEYVL